MAHEAEDDANAAHDEAASGELDHQPSAKNLKRMTTLQKQLKLGRSTQAVMNGYAFKEEDGSVIGGSSLVAVAEDEGPEDLFAARGSSAALASREASAVPTVVVSGSPSPIARVNRPMRAAHPQARDGLSGPCSVQLFPQRQHATAARLAS